MQKPKINHKTKKNGNRRINTFCVILRKDHFQLTILKKKNIEYNKNKTADGRESQNKKKEIKSHILTKYGRTY